jgi:UDP-glucuronate decarboxylase
MSTEKTILVTGGAGFLGSHLCQRLINENHKVICLDNFYTGSHSNIKPLLSSPHFSLIEQDVCDPINVTVDQIYHLACPASPVHYQSDPIQTTKTSVLGALNVLDCATRCKATVMFASTSEVYGDPLVHPQTEEYWGHVHTTGPRACYDEGKRCAESLFMDYHRMHQTDIRIARILIPMGRI